MPKLERPLSVTLKLDDPSNVVELLDFIIRSLRHSGSITITVTRPTGFKQERKPGE